MRPQPQRENDPLELDQLKEELHLLERRVVALEHPAPKPLEQLLQPAAATPEISMRLEYLASAPNAIPAAGRAVLGLAGACLLRALAESGCVPMPIVIVFAILYAVTWLVLSVRTREQDIFGSTLYGATAALILAPLLWKATVRFNALPAAATAGLLVAFLLLASALAWARTSAAVIAVTTIATLVTALGLIVQTGRLVPFSAALLGIALVIEASPARGHARNMMAPAAMAADIAIWLTHFVITQPDGVPKQYMSVGVATCIALATVLLLIYSGSVVWRTVAMGQHISAGYTVQVIVTFVLAAGGALLITQGGALATVGALCAIACAACYFTAFIRFGDSERRNHHLFASFGAMLGILAGLPVLPVGELTPILSAAAVLTILAGTNVSQPTLRIHGALYLLAAALISGLPQTVFNAFTGEKLRPAPLALWLVAVPASC